MLLRRAWKGCCTIRIKGEKNKVRGNRENQGVLNKRRIHCLYRYGVVYAYLFVCFLVCSFLFVCLVLCVCFNVFLLYICPDPFP